MSWKHKPPHGAAKGAGIALAAGYGRGGDHAQRAGGDAGEHHQGHGHTGEQTKLRSGGLGAQAGAAQAYRQQHGLQGAHARQAQAGEGGGCGKAEDLRLHRGLCLHFAGQGKGAAEDQHHGQRGQGFGCPG
jgi:hypothetical protein